MKNLCHIVGLFSEGFEDKIMTLFIAIEGSRHQNGLASAPNLCSKSSNRGNRELKRLVCSINYDLKGGHSNRVKCKGRGPTCSL